MMPKLRFIPFLLMWQFFGFNKAQCLTFAEATKAELHEYFSFLASQNNDSPLETAGAHGVHGFRLGAGGSTMNLPQSSIELIRSDYDLSPQLGKTSFVPQISLVKGLFYPLDVGLSYSRPSPNVSIFGGYGQWTLFEALATPALALRMGFSQFSGLQETEFASQSIQVLASWGLFFASIYGGYGRSFNSAATGFEKRQWQSPLQTIGIYLQVLPPFLTFALEQQKNGESNPTYRAKLSLGL